MILRLNSLSSCCLRCHRNLLIFDGAWRQSKKYTMNVYTGSLPSLSLDFGAFQTLLILSLIFCLLQLFGMTYLEDTPKGFHPHRSPTPVGCKHIAKYSLTEDQRSYYLISDETWVTENSIRTQCDNKDTKLEILRFDRRCQEIK